MNAHDFIQAIAFWNAEKEINSLQNELLFILANHPAMKAAIESKGYVFEESTDYQCMGEELAEFSTKIRHDVSAEIENLECTIDAMKETGSLPPDLDKKLQQLKLLHRFTELGSHIEEGHDTQALELFAQEFSEMRMMSVTTSDGILSDTLEALSIFMRLSKVIAQVFNAPDLKDEERIDLSSLSAAR